MNPFDPRPLSPIVIHGARTHNLRNVSVAIPRNRFVVITGPSGSGKSSLAFDTLHAESRRRFVDAMNLRDRDAFGVLARPDCDAIHGLTPTIALEQRLPPRSPRATVGTATELLEVARILYGRLGTAHCPACDRSITRWTPARIATHVESLPVGARVLLLASAPGGPGARERLARDGHTRVLLAGSIVRLDELDTHITDLPDPVDVVIDRFIVRPDMRARLVESVETALKLGCGTIGLASAETPHVAQPERFSVLSRCEACNLDLPPLTPDLLQFTTTLGACSACAGAGHTATVSEPIAPKNSQHKLKPDDVDAEIDPDQDTVFRQPDGVRCHVCAGTRHAPSALAARLGGVAFRTFITTPIRHLGGLLTTMALPPAAAESAFEGLATLRSRLDTLNHLDLGHLDLARGLATLSTGEYQRIRLVAQIGSELSGVTYVLDEPSSGLHPDDALKLVTALRALVAAGNTVVAVEHDRAIMAEADHIIDMGPGAGALGGMVVASGPPAEIAAHSTAPSGPWLQRPPAPVVPIRQNRSVTAIQLSDICTANLQSIHASIPLNAITAVTGPSGSGKSALVFGALAPLLRSSTQQSRRPLATASLAGIGSAKGLDPVTRVIAVDQSPISRSARASVVTWVGAFDEIRRLFAQVPDARAAGYTATRFSFNSPGGRCEHCRGEGVIRLDMGFLSDIVAPCEVCGGKRFNDATLRIRYRGLDIGELLELQVSDARPLFQAIQGIARIFDTLDAVGLGYLKLGQSGAALSGGEAQRLRIARELGRAGGGHTVYLVDEPSRGLHPRDVAQLLEVLRRLVDAGNTVVMTEHDPWVVAHADHIIELGPGAGPAGGHIIASGHPEDLVGRQESRTGRHLRDLLAPPAR